MEKREGGKRLSQILPGSTALAEAGRSPEPGHSEGWMLWSFLSHIWIGEQGSVNSSRSPGTCYCTEQKVCRLREVTNLTPGFSEFCQTVAGSSLLTSTALEVREEGTKRATGCNILRPSE